MEKAYVLQDKNGYVTGITLEEIKAQQLCKSNQFYTYRMVDFYKCSGTEITMTAGPIESEYLKHQIIKNNNGRE